MKNVIFLSHIIGEKTPLYGGERSIVIKKVKSIKKGDPYNKTHWSFSAHTGTHIDAPWHFLAEGKSISDLSAGELLFSKVHLVEVKSIGPGYIINEKDLNGVEDCDLLFIRTGFEKNRNRAIYWRNSPALDARLASWLKEACPSIRAVGVDFISLTNLNNRELGTRAHKAFLGRSILVIEDMKLKGLRHAPDSVVVAPLLVEGAEAAPSTILGIYN